MSKPNSETVEVQSETEIPLLYSKCGNCKHLYYVGIWNYPYFCNVRGMLLPKSVTLNWAIYCRCYEHK